MVVARFPIEAVREDDTVVTRLLSVSDTTAADAELVEIVDVRFPTEEFNEDDADR